MDVIKLLRLLFCLPVTSKLHVLMTGLIIKTLKRVIFQKIRDRHLAVVWYVFSIITVEADNYSLYIIQLDLINICLHLRWLRDFDCTKLIRILKKRLKCFVHFQVTPKIQEPGTLTFTREDKY